MAGNKLAREIFGISSALDEFKNMVNMKKVELKQRESGSKKRPPILTPEILEEQNVKALRNDTNFLGKRKLMQLERLQRLHILYKDNVLHKCLLSYFLLVTEETRLKLLSWMGSDMASQRDRTREDRPRQNPQRRGRDPGAPITETQNC